MAPLLRDLSEAYTRRARGEPPSWAPLSVHYADYTLWQRDWLGVERSTGTPSADQLAYWKHALAGMPEQLELSFDRARPPLATYRGDRVRLSIDPELQQRITALSATTGVTPFMVIQAAFATLLNRHGAGMDIPIGTPVAGRSETVLEELVGFFVNTLVLRTDLSGNPRFDELLRRVRETAIGAYAHQDVPFERLVDALKPARSLAHHPLFQVMYQARLAWAALFAGEAARDRREIRPHADHQPGTRRGRNPAGTASRV
jgi:hypothetical protein